jgi:hypothetical protein
MHKADDPLAFLLDLNQSVANREDAGQPVNGPGLPATITAKSKFVTTDCLSMPKA